MAMALGATFGSRFEVTGAFPERRESGLQKGEIRVARLDGFRGKELDVNITTPISRLREKAGRFLGGFASFFKDLPDVGNPQIVSVTPARDFPKLESIPAGTVLVNGEPVVDEFYLADKALNSAFDTNELKELATAVMNQVRETGESVQDALRSLTLQEAVAATIGALILFHPSTGGTESHIVNRSGVERRLPEGNFGPGNTMDPDVFNALIGRK